MAAGRINQPKVPKPRTSDSSNDKKLQDMLDAPWSGGTPVVPSGILKPDPMKAGGTLKAPFCTIQKVDRDWSEDFGPIGAHTGKTSKKGGQ